MRVSPRDQLPCSCGVFVLLDLYTLRLHYAKITMNKNQTCTLLCRGKDFLAKPYEMKQVCMCVCVCVCVCVCE